jgi:hypothetical protein
MRDSFEFFSQFLNLGVWRVVCPPSRTPFFHFLFWFSPTVLGQLRFISGLGFFTLPGTASTSMF